MSVTVESVQTGSAVQTAGSAFSSVRNRLLKVDSIFDPYQQIIVMGAWPGHGKSTAINSIDQCCKIDSEGGLVEMAVKYGINPADKEFPIPVRRWEDVTELIDALIQDAKNNGEKRTYRMVAFDTLDMLAGTAFSIAAEYILRTSNMTKKRSDDCDDFIGEIGKGIGWQRLAELANRHVLLPLIGAGYGIVCSVHFKRKMIEVNGQTVQSDERNLTKNVDGFLTGISRVNGVIRRMTDVQRTPVYREVNGKQIKVKDDEKAVQKYVWSPIPLGADSGDWLKARICDSTPFEFEAAGQKSWWPQFKAAFEKGVAQIKEGLK